MSKRVESTAWNLCGWRGSVSASKRIHSLSRRSGLRWSAIHFVVVFLSAQTNFHSIAQAGTTYDGGATFGGWLQANNWNDNVVPTFGNTTDLTFSTANWNGNLSTTSIEANRTVRGINIGQGWATAGNGTFYVRPMAANATSAQVLTFDSDAGNAFINVTASADGAVRNIIFGGSNAAHPNGSFSLSDDLNITNSSTVSSITFNRPINGASRSVTKLGVGTLIFDMMGSGSYGYSGSTTVSAGTLQVNAAASIASTSAVNVGAGGRLVYNSSTALTVAPSLAGAGVGSRAILGGTGTINAALTLNNLGDVLSPGNSPGILPFGTSQSWDSFTYDWESNDWTGTVAGTAFDQIAITGGLTLSPSGSYQLDLISLTAGDVPGTIPNYVDQDRSWTIVSTTAGITGFDASKWNIVTTGFTGVTGTSGRTFSVQQTGNSIELVYAVPEPATLGLVAAAGLLTAAGIARRRARS